MSRKKIKSTTMKNINLKLLIMTALFGVVFVSCKKDNADKESQVQYDGTTSNLSKGYLINYGIENASPASYYYSLIISSPEVTFDFAQDTVYGIGDAIAFDIYSASATDLVPGTYNFDATTYNANTFEWGIFVADYNFVTDEGTTGVEIISGTVTVSKSGTTYEITVDGTVDGGKKITAYYKGSLEYHDSSSMKTTESKKFRFNK
jgi:hypothetical protein